MTSILFPQHTVIIIIIFFFFPAPHPDPEFSKRQADFQDAPKDELLDIIKGLQEWGHYQQ